MGAFGCLRVRGAADKADVHRVAPPLAAGGLDATDDRQDGVTDEEHEGQQEKHQEDADVRRVAPSRELAGTARPITQIRYGMKKVIWKFSASVAWCFTNVFFLPSVCRITSARIQPPMNALRCDNMTMLRPLSIADGADAAGPQRPPSHHRIVPNWSGYQPGGGVVMRTS